jgi:hypothetical protein
VWWLIFRRDGELVGVAIIEAPSLMHVRMIAVAGEVGRIAEYSDGKEIDPERAALIPPEFIGSMPRMLSPEQARELTTVLGRRDDPIRASILPDFHYRSFGRVWSGRHQGQQLCCRTPRFVNATMKVRQPASSDSRAIYFRFGVGFAFGLTDAIGWSL